MSSDSANLDALRKRLAENQDGILEHLATAAVVVIPTEVREYPTGQTVLLEAITDEFARFTHLNDFYKAKFDFPFIFAVKGATKHQILASFMERVNNSAADEFAMAITQICRIFRFRIEDRVAP